MRAAILLACLGFASACACEREHGAPAPEAPVPAHEAADSQGRIDPAPYRARIEATEALLYSVDALSDDGWRALSKAFLDLHNEIVFRDDTANAREASARLFFLSARADAMTSTRGSEIELAQLRELWLKLCAEKFTPADWIRAQAPLG